MIVCSCAALSDHEIRRVVAAIFAADPYAVVTPGLVYHRAGRRVRCAACRPLTASVIADAIATSQTTSREGPRHEG